MTFSKNARAPSAIFLNPHGLPDDMCTTLTDRDTAFIGATTGFLPPKPLSKLDAPFVVWSDAAHTLPDAVRTSDWQFLSSIPLLSTSNLQDNQLLSANAALGALAHAVKNVADLEVPQSIMQPWTEIGRRLMRPTPSFNSLDWFLYNYETIPHRFSTRISSASLPLSPASPRVSNSSLSVSDPWLQTRPALTVTGTMTETHFITSCYAIEHAASVLPALIATAQTAVLTQSDAVLRNTLVSIISIIEEMTVSFRSGDMRTHAATYIDPVEWGRVIGVVGLPVVKGEKTISGLLFPSVHLLDVFFGRDSYRTEMGVLENTDRRWLPPLHREFLAVVQKISVGDYITSRLEKQSGHELMSVFRQAVNAFAGTEGFLGKHRLRIAAFLELSMKVGRPATAAGTRNAHWQGRPWRHINAAMSEGMKERLEGCQKDVFRVSVRGVCPVEGAEDSATKVVLDTHGALVYSPGDHLAVLPKNHSDLVDDTLDALHLRASDRVPIREPGWLKILGNLGIFSSESSGQITIRADEFFQLASLQPMDERLAGRLISVFFVTNPAAKSYLLQERAINVPMALNMIHSLNSLSVSVPRDQLDTIFEPLAPRYYSISSHFENSPNSVEIIVGAVNYNAQPKISFRKGFIPWRKLCNDSFALLMPNVAAQSLSKYTAKSTIDFDDDFSVVSKDIDPSVSFEDTSDKSDVNSSKTSSDDEMNGLEKKRLSEITETLRNASFDAKSHGVSAKARYRAQVMCYDAKICKTSPQNLKGISSSYLDSRIQGDPVMAYVMPELDFRMPSSLDAPMMMIALGTGVAPFRSFLKQLILEKQRTCSWGSYNPLRQAWLILGVQSRDRIPFRKELEEAFCREKVISLSIAFSREDVELNEDASLKAEKLVFQSGRRARVNNMFERNDRLAQKIWGMLNRGGHVYCCGMPQLERLARDLVAFAVRRFATSLWGYTYFDTNSQLASLADEYADRLAAERRLHVDAFYSGRPISSADLFSASEVAKHRSITDCWTIFRGAVYDISQYLHVHPGGPKILFDKAGRDMTDDFNIAHGEFNVRIAGMLTPYRVGTLNTYGNINGKLRKLVVEWCGNLLNEVLEHRSVFLLDINRFPELKEPLAFRSFKSQIDMPGASGTLCLKFWSQYEPDIFVVLENAIKNDRLGKALETFKLACGELDYSKVQIALSEARKSEKFNSRIDQVKAWKNGQSDRVYESELRQYKKFMESIIDCCIQAQQVALEVAQVQSKNVEFEDVCVVLVAKLVDSFISGVSHCYNDLLEPASL